MGDSGRLIIQNGIKPQNETLFYSFHKGKVYFLLEFKKRTINNQFNCEWSWGPSLGKTQNTPGTPKDNYHMHLTKTKYCELKKTTSFWIEIEEIEKIINTPDHRLESKNKNGLSEYKIEILPKIEPSIIKKSHWRQQRIYYKMVHTLRTNKTNFFKEYFPQLKQEAQEELEKELELNKELIELEKLYLKMESINLEEKNNYLTPEYKFNAKENGNFHVDEWDKRGEELYNFLSDVSEEGKNYYLPRNLLDE
ncbi:MAG: hypothetical protein ABIA74_02095 [bacterium]